ncbi:MAG: 50S ribosomal protein L35 [Anaerolineae bacterium]|nr:50S ribosomal protein L35 [Anaerolineae bacterium]MCA9908905.1 50S ribosomal protein L35 [Anaerolineae bacterium]
MVGKLKKYKLKTHKATVKRFKMTATGKILRTKGGKTHFRRRRAQRSLNQLSKMQPVAESDLKKVRRLAPYLKYYKTAARSK